MNSEFATIQISGTMNEKDVNKDAIYCNNGAWEAFINQLSTINVSSIFILVDTNTKKECLPVFLEQSKLPEPFSVVEIPSGETNKTIATCEKLWTELSDKGADRSSLLINLGGGVITDLGGFVAATFKRGISFINIPTSLLAMVDASIGGKNGVDLGMLKNQIGLIQKPNAVIIDTLFLKTLPKEELVSGYAEMLKHGLIYSEDYWNEIQSFFEADDTKIAKLIWDSVCIKKEVVDEDPREENRRKTLNYGHTLGHAIETYSHQDTTRAPLLHGEAVAIGMILATFISSELHGFPKEKLKHVVQVIQKHFKKQDFSKTDIEAIIGLLIFDKKNRNGIVYFVLLTDFGKYKTNQIVPNDLIYKAFNFYLGS